MRLVKPKPESPSSLDDLFVEKYDWLMRWALYFAQGERATAEDLVQDTFVRFAVSHPELDHEENAEKLLFKYLKYVDQERVYRLQKYPHQNLSVEEFDSLGLGLRQSPSLNPVDIQNALRRILIYLCWRKESTKAASILILRFFYGFFPEEIMQIGILSRQVVDNGLLAARRDLKRHFAESASGRVRPLDAKFPPAFVPALKASETEDFIGELRSILLGSRRGECLPVEELYLRYEAESPKPLECELLAHLVSCRHCLEIAIRSKKLPPLDGRSFESALVGRHDSKPPATKVERDKSLRRSLGIVHDRIEEVMQHRPKSLSVVVNGHIVATQEVNSAISKQEVEIRVGAPIELVEILSEQGLCLLAMSVDEELPAVAPELYRLAHLRGDRTVEVWLRFLSTGPRIETLYRDPAFALAPVDSTLEQLIDESSDKKEDGPFDSRRETPLDHDRFCQIESSAFPSQSRESALGAISLTGTLSARTPFAATTLFASSSDAGASSRLPLWSQFHAFLLGFTRPSMNPMLATALGLAVTSIVFFALWWRQPLNITENAFLVRAEAWDTGGQRTAKFGVIEQHVSIKAPGYSVTRAIYRDAQGLRCPKRHKLAWADEALKTRLAASGIDWDAPLSATTYQDWHDHQRVRADSIARAGSQLIKLTTTVPNGQIRQESLTVRTTDFHPVERTVEFDNHDTVEIAELDYSVLPWGPTTEGWFEPVNTRSLQIPRSAPQGDLSPRLPSLPSESELDEAEIEARLALYELNADSTHERIGVERSGKGIQVKGIVATAQRKRQIEDRLHPIPYLFASIFTFDELTSRQAPESRITSVKSASLSQSPSPLEQYLSGRGVSRAEIGEIGGEFSDASISINQESKAIADLLKEFGANRNLSLSAQEGLERLLAEHKSKILTSLASEEKVLGSLEASGHPGEDGGRVSVTASSPAVLLAALESHRALATELISGNSSQSRNATEIALDLDRSLRRLRAIVEGLSDPLPVSALASPPSSNQNKK